MPTVRACYVESMRMLRWEATPYHGARLLFLRWRGPLAIAKIFLEYALCLLVLRLCNRVLWECLERSFLSAKELFEENLTNFTCHIHASVITEEVSHVRLESTSYIEKNILFQTLCPSRCWMHSIINVAGDYLT